MPDEIMELSGRVTIADENLAQRKPETVARIPVATERGVRALEHEQAQEPRGHRRGSQPSLRSAAAGRWHRAILEAPPDPGGVVIDRLTLITVPVFHQVSSGIWRAPEQPDVANRGCRPQIDREPLGMLGFWIAGKSRIEVGIGLPERCRVAIIDPGIAVIAGIIDGSTAARESVAISQFDRRAGAIIRNPIPLVMHRVAPTAFWIPVQIGRAHV